MKKLFFILLLYIIFPTNIFADEGWVIEKFYSNIDVKSNGIVSITETITLDFQQLEKHGIYRDIPYVYQDANGKKLYTNINVLGVQRDGNPEPYDVTKNSSSVRIKIGAPDTTISGRHTYHVDYTATGVLKGFTDYDEFYWNATSNSWGVPIHKAESQVTLPIPITQSACYVGNLGSTEPCMIQTLAPERYFFTTNRSLAPNEGLTIAVGYAKNSIPLPVVAQPKTLIDTLFTLQSFLSFLTAFIIGILFIIVIWYKNGRDYRYRIRRMLSPTSTEEIAPIGTKESIVIEFTPPGNLRPAEMGVLLDEQADTLDVTATIIDLATRGYLHITEIPKKWLFGSIDYEFKRMNSTDTTLLSYEALLMNRLFSEKEKVKLSSLKTTFYDDLSNIKDKLYEDIQKKKFFVENPQKIRRIYIGVGFILFVSGICCSIIGGVNILGYIFTFGIGLTLISILFMLSARFMPRRTAVGRELYVRSLGYKHFIKTAETHRQTFFENKNMFNEVLPFAIMFGLTEKFAKAMKDIGLQQTNPTWYHGTHSFNPVIFGSSMNSLSKSMSSAIASTPRSSGSSGGGFSGGGFGGGGGGSW